MYTTQNLLKNCTAHYLRAVLSKLALRNVRLNRKEQWSSHIHDYLLSPALVDELVPSLSCRAHQALFRLATTESLPTLLFLNEYGPIRYPRPSGPDAPEVSNPDGPAPWRDPKSPAEELYYSGLLYSGDQRPLAKCNIVTLPIEIRERLTAFAAQSGSDAETALPSALPAAGTKAASSHLEADGASRPGLKLLHDLSQLLIYLDSQETSNEPPIQLLHGRWLPPSALRQLNLRLLWSEPEGALRSHRQCRWLAFLFSTALRTQLIARQQKASGETTCGLTAYAWHWLSLPPVQQLHALWERWLFGHDEDPNENGLKEYDQPGGHIRSPWLTVVCRYLSNDDRQNKEMHRSTRSQQGLATQDLTVRGLTAQRLANRMLSNEQVLHPFFLAWFYQLADIDKIIYEMLSETFCFWGIVEPTGLSASSLPTMPQSSMPARARPTAKSHEQIEDERASNHIRNYKELADAGQLVGVEWVPLGEYDQAYQEEARERLSQQWQKATAHFQVTELGAWLLNRSSGQASGQAGDKGKRETTTEAPIWAWLEQPPSPQPPTTPDSFDQESWLVAAPTLAPPLRVAQVASFARYKEEHLGGAATESKTHQYLIDKQSVGIGASQGRSLPTLLDGLLGLGFQPTAAQTEMLHGWYQEGVSLSVGFWPLIQTDSTKQMAQLRAERSVKAFLTSQYSPTLAGWAGSLDSFVAALRGAGFYPKIDGVHVESPPPVDDTEPPADGTEQPAGDMIETQDAGVLWLAGQLYHTLGAHLPMPVPLSTHLLNRLYAQLDVEAQAVLQSQLTELQNDLQRVLDQKPFTPPPTPSDPEEWLPILKHAIGHEKTLTVTYFSAGRNMRTQRQIDPHWIEEDRNTLYVRAYCHSRGEIVTFRLDRFESMKG